MMPDRTRMAVIGGAGMAFFLLLAVRLVQLTILWGDDLGRRARAQQQEKTPLIPYRGAIVDRHGEILALSGQRESLYVRPHQAQAHETAVRAVSATLELPLRTVAEKFHSPAPFVWLKRQATPDQATSVMNLGVEGIGTVVEQRRFYPHGSLAAHILGFAGIDSQGLEGVELFWDHYLRGNPTSVAAERDALGRRMLTAGQFIEDSPQGAAVQLSVDTALQYVAEEELRQAVEGSRAQAGIAIVLDPVNGEILALAQIPTFDPNRPAASPLSARRNRAVVDCYEPGSTLKAILAAAALEEGVFRPDDLVFCEGGKYRIGRHVIHDHHSYQWLTLAEVIQNSSNIGAVKIGEKLGKDRYAAYLRAFGFGRPTGVDLPGEISGLFPPPEHWTHATLATTSFGQGIAVTPLQLVRAFAAIANGGFLIRPHVVKKVMNGRGETLYQNEVWRHRILGEKTVQLLSSLLTGVVEEGTGTEARVDGFTVAGKTGTAQKVNPEGKGYSATERIASFVGFVPAEEPRLVILVMIDEPRTSRYGGVVAAPIFRAIAQRGLALLGVGKNPKLPVPPPDPEKEIMLVSAAREGMPSFLGMSLREAVTRAHRDGWHTEVHGTGYVTAQRPSPGALTWPEKQVCLYLQPPETALR